jgi:flagellin
MSALTVTAQSISSAAITSLDSAINQVSSERAKYGAVQNRLESTIRSLAVASENTSAANSRIADADIAQSMSEMVRTQILQQAGISVLAQANQSPSLVLQLLKEVPGLRCGTTRRAGQRNGHVGNRTATRSRPSR